MLYANGVSAAFSHDAKGFLGKNTVLWRKNNNKKSNCNPDLKTNFEHAKSPPVTLIYLHWLFEHCIAKLLLSGNVWIWSRKSTAKERAHSANLLWIKKKILTTRERNLSKVCLWEVMHSQRQCIVQNKL